MKYTEEIIKAFLNLRSSDIDEVTLHQIRRTLIDYLGCAAYTAKNELCSLIKETATSVSRTGDSTVWGRDGARLCPEAAALINAARVSNSELDDVSGMGASVHPGVYVWSSLIALCECYSPTKEEALRAILFGYDLCLRMGLLSTERVRELGLHGPGLNGAFASLAVGSVIRGLTEEETLNAIGIAGSLLPLCPFVSFTSGTDSKDLYGGWGTYLGLIAVNAAKRGATGPSDIIDGNKSLRSIYNGKRAEGELAKDFLINKISFKEFSACASVHPALSALIKLKESSSFSLEDIKHIEIETYPYSYALNSSVSYPLNVSSARLSLPYTISVCLLTGGLMPDAFTPEALESKRYMAFIDKVSVSNHTEYGDSAFSIRGAIVRLELNNGKIIESESIGSRWSTSPSDEELFSKFKALSASSFSKEKQDRIIELTKSFDGDLKPIIDYLRSIK